MDILKIAFKYAPNETAKTMAQIYKEDSNISKLTKKLSKNNLFEALNIEKTKFSIRIIFSNFGNFNLF